ncbi:MAG TPA: GDSL-type esterase/lipase family protein [Fibrobacteria bacterium]|nr:GDSL-type esterase/lipase family protein [Fibrobacteria bacterium]
MRYWAMFFAIAIFPQAGLGKDRSHAGQPETLPSAGFASVDVPADDPRLQYTGRFEASDPKHPRCDWPASGIRARFTGGSVSVKLNGGKNNFEVSIDGQARAPIALQDGKDTYALATGLATGEHVLALTKRTEGSGGITTFSGLVLDDGAAVLAPPSRPPWRVQVLGESYAAGYGAEGPSSSCGDRRPYDNAAKTFGAVLARALDAELSLQAISCIGLIHNCGDKVTPSKEPFTAFYKRTLNGSAAPAWNAAAWIPDLVVVTLANNDLDGAVKPTKEQFISGYRAFLADLRASWPGAGFICVAFGFDNADPARNIKREYINDIVAQEIAAGHARTEFLFYGNLPSAPAQQGCNGHPNAAAHQKIADALYPLARKLLPGTPVMPGPRSARGIRTPGSLPIWQGWADGSQPFNILGRWPGRHAETLIRRRSNVRAIDE